MILDQNAPDVGCHPGIRNHALRPFERLVVRTTPEGNRLVAMPVGTGDLGGRPVRIWLYLLASKDEGLDKVVCGATTYADVSLDEEYQELVENTNRLLSDLAALTTEAPSPPASVAMH